MKNKMLVLFLVFMVSDMAMAEWTPPDNPDLQEILSQAAENRKNKEYATALKQHIWFHENSLKYDPGFYGVRLSFALSDWVELSKFYEPALKALLELSDKNEVKVKTGSDCCKKAFHDFTAINRELGRQEKIVELFKWLDENKPIVAKSNFSLAKPALVQAKEYKLCGKYVDPESNYLSFKTMYTVNTELANDPRFGSELKEFAEKSFVNEVTTLVAILVLNNRKEEASKVTEDSLTVMNTECFKKELDKALSGYVPSPWP